jgi:hypothetical protein
MQVDYSPAHGVQLLFEARFRLSNQINDGYIADLAENTVGGQAIAIIANLIGN